MLNFICYIFRGLIHYTYLLFNMLDFKDYGFMILIVFGIIIIIMINKNVRKSVNRLIISFFNVIKTPPGTILMILFISYYVYIILYFEENISALILLMSIYLLFQSFAINNLNLLADSKKTNLDVIKDFSVPVVLLAFQQFISMLEFNDFTNWKHVIISLIVIPIFSLLFVVLKHFVNFEEFYKANKKYISISGYDFFKLFNYSLIECGNYYYNKILLEKLVKENKNLTFEQSKNKIKEIFPEVITIYNLDNEKASCKHVKCKNGKVFIFFNYIWCIGALYLIVMILFKRFCNINYNFFYYFTYVILLIYFLYDLLRIKRVKNQMDFVIYGFIYIFLIILLIVYAISLNQTRLSEMGFLIPLFIVIRIISYTKNSINFLSLPILSEDNFFGLPPKN